MNIPTSSKFARTALSLLVGGAFTALGCSLIVDFDASKIPQDGGPTFDSTADSETGDDTSVTTDSTPEAGDDAADSTVDSTIDSTADSADAEGDAADTTPDAADTADTADTSDGFDGFVCAQPSDCPAPANDCQSATCTANTCGTTNKAASAACASNGGKLCDGNGTCVACLAPTDCPATGTACKTNTCTAGACGTANAPLGTACSDGGGVVCNGSGVCVSSHCMDGVKDADETDVDCGGATCAACVLGKACGTTTDCVPGTASCSGTTYTPVNQCASNVCATGTPVNCASTGKVCNVAAGCVQCNTAADCGSSSCSGNVFTAASTCSASNTCVAGTQTTCTGTTPVCNTTAGCVQCNTAADCPASSCSGTVFTPAATCGGSNTCLAGGPPTDCATNTVSTVCNPTFGCVQCNASADCSGTTPICDTTAHACVQCLTNSDCPMGTPTCNTTTHVCG